MRKKKGLLIIVWHNIKNDLYINTLELTEQEKRVLLLFIEEKTYEEIAKKLNCKTKSVDTAMTRRRLRSSLPSIVMVLQEPSTSTLKRTLPALGICLKDLNNKNYPLQCNG